MSATILTRAREPFPIAVPGLSFLPAAPSLWRVARLGGAVLGHIERSGSEGSERYRARRLVPGGIRSIELGEFWSARAAADVFR